MKSESYAMVSKLFRGIICGLITIMLLMCGTFFWGAYNNHRLTLHTISNESKAILGEISGVDNKLVEKRIEKLKDIQRDLFETNTISFFFNLFMVIIVTVGGYILSTTLKNQKDAEFTLSNIQKCLSVFIGNLRFEMQLQSSFSLLHGLIVSRPVIQNREFYVEMRDTLRQINRDCASIPISEIAMSLGSSQRLVGRIYDIDNRLRSAGIQDRNITADLQEAYVFLKENQSRFDERWRYVVENLEIKSIDIRE